jgi:leukotriene-A4 hydrolase
LNKNLLKPNDIEFNTKEWLYEKGIPKNCVRIQSPRFLEVENLAEEFASGKDIFKKKRNKKTRKFEYLNREKYITQEWLAFIRKLPRNLSVNQMEIIDEKLNFKNSGNAEIMTEWFILGIQTGYKSIRPEMEKFLQKVGRRKFLLPIYKNLVNSKDKSNLKFAKDVYTKARPFYHSVSQKTMDELLGIK